MTLLRKDKETMKPTIPNETWVEYHMGRPHYVTLPEPAMVTSSYVDPKTKNRCYFVEYANGTKGCWPASVTRPWLP